MIRVLRFGVWQYILQPRWLVPLLVFVFLAYITVDTAVIRGMNSDLPVNTWDALFNTFGNQNIIFYVLVPLYLFLVVDIVIESDLGDAVLLRFGTRQRWWLGKVLTLIVAALAFTGLAVAIVGVAATISMPWVATWSLTAQNDPIILFIAPEVLTLSPMLVFIQLLAQLLLGLFTLGLLTTVLGLITENPLWGFGTGFALGLVSRAVGLQRPISYLFLVEHILYAPSYIDTTNPTLSLIGSIAYWSVLSGLLIAFGFRLSAGRDFLSREIRE